MKKKLSFIALLICAVIISYGCSGMESKSDNSEMQSGSDNSEMQSESDNSETKNESVWEQAADPQNGSAKLSLEDGKNISITSEGEYLVTGSAKDACLIIDAPKENVTLILDNVSIVNSSFPAINVKKAKNTTIILKGENSLEVSGMFTADENTNPDAVIFSKKDLLLSGDGTLTIRSSKHGITGKDNLTIDGGTYTISAAQKGLEAKDDLTIGGGSFDIDAYEGLEGSYVQINGGILNIHASNDGINASNTKDVEKSVIEINGGDITIVMDKGDIDGIDSNGYLYVNGGNINVTGDSPIDFDYGSEFKGGNIIINGEKVSEIPNSSSHYYGQ